MKPRKPIADSTTVIAQLTNKDGERTFSANMSALLAFGEEFAHRMKTAMESFSKTRAYPTHAYAHQIQRWGLCIRDNDIDISSYDLTASEDLDELHLIYLEWFFTKNPSIQKSNLETLKRHWTNQGDFIKFCQNSKILPAWEWFIFPKQRSAAPRDYREDSEINITGQHQRKKSGDFFNKIAATESLSFTTHDAVAELKKHLQINLQTLEKLALSEINRLVANYEIGTNLAEDADVKILEKLSPGDPPERFIIKSNSKLTNRRATVTKSGIERKAISYWRSESLHIFSPSYEKGINNLIWWLRKHHNGYIPRDYISLSGKFAFSELDIIRHHPIDKIQNYFGVMTHRNLIPFILLLFCRCKEISNLDPVLRISVKDITQINNGIDRISVDKRRANAIKSAILDSETRSALAFLEERTARYRDELSKLEGRPCLSLFIGLKSDTYAGTPRPLKGTSSTGKLLKQLLKSNDDLVDLHGITFSSIRNTHSVVAYIESEGDWHQVARALGHSVQTAMRHYIPPELTALLRERKARQHQNEMLIVASYGQPFDLLDAVDFRTTEEVETFLTNVLRIDNNRTDVLLAELDRKIKLTFPSDETPATEPHPTELAHIALSVQGLAALFRYEKVISMGNSIAAESSCGGAPTIFWSQLSFGLRKLLSSENYPNEEHLAIFKAALAISNTARA